MRRFAMGRSRHDGRVGQASAGPFDYVCGGARPTGEMWTLEPAPNGLGMVDSRICHGYIRYMPIHATTFRLTQEDVAILDEARASFGLASRTEALRLLIRLWDGSVDVLGAAKTAKDRARRQRKTEA